MYQTVSEPRYDNRVQTRGGPANVRIFKPTAGDLQQSIPPATGSFSLFTQVEENVQIYQLSELELAAAILRELRSPARSVQVSRRLSSVTVYMS